MVQKDHLLPAVLRDFTPGMNESGGKSDAQYANAGLGFAAKTIYLPE